MPNRPGNVTNKEGKGGFGDNPQNRSDGRWSKEASFSYWYNKFKSMTGEELAVWQVNNPKNERLIAADLALTRITNSTKDLKEFQEVADRSEGKPRQAVDITTGGDKIQPASIVDLGNLKHVSNQSETKPNSASDKES